MSIKTIFTNLILIYLLKIKITFESEIEFYYQRLNNSHNHNHKQIENFSFEINLTNIDNHINKIEKIENLLQKSKNLLINVRNINKFNEESSKLGKINNKIMNINNNLLHSLYISSSFMNFDKVEIVQNDISSTLSSLSSRIISNYMFRYLFSYENYNLNPLFMLVVTDKDLLLFNLDDYSVFDSDSLKQEFIYNNKYSFDQNGITIKKSSFDIIDQETLEVVIISDDDKVISKLFYISSSFISTSEESESTSNSSLLPRKYSLINTNTTEIVIDLDSVNELKHIKYHSQRYLLFSNQQGKVQIYSLKSKIELRTSFKYSTYISSTYISNGILAIVSLNEVIFTNVLGGNSILLKCYSFSNIISIFFDTSSSFLYILNEYGQLVVYNIKLTMSKVNLNECSEIYQYQFEKYDTNQMKIISSSNVKDIFIKISSAEIFLLPLRRLQKEGSFCLERILIKKSFPRDEQYFTDNIILIYDDITKKYMVSNQILRNSIVVLTIDPSKIYIKGKNKEKDGINDKEQGFGFGFFIINIIVIFSVGVIVFYYKKYMSNSNNSYRKRYKEDRFLMENEKNNLKKGDSKKNN